MRGGNVKEAEFIRAGRVIEPRLLHRVAGILEVNEIDALDHAAIGDVEAGNDAGADGHAAACATAMAVLRSRRPSYSARPVMTPSIPSSA